MAPRSAARSRGGKTPGTSKKQYRQVKGVRYDDGALAIADDVDKISLPVAKAIFEEVQDGGVVTPTEWRTLSYIADGGKDGAQYALTAPARKYLLDLVRAEDWGGEEEEDGDGNLAENDIETDEEEDLPATVRKVRGSGGNDDAAGAGARNKRVSFGAARDDVSVGPPIANVNARRRGGGGGGILSPKIAAPPGTSGCPAATTTTTTITAPQTPTRRRRRRRRSSTFCRRRRGTEPPGFPLARPPAPRTRGSGVGPSTRSTTR